MNQVGLAIILKGRRMYNWGSMQDAYKVHSMKQKAASI